MNELLYVNVFTCTVRLLYSSKQVELSGKIRGSEGHGDAGR